VRLTTSPSSRAECHEIWETKLRGTLGPHRDSYGTPLPLYKQIIIDSKPHGNVVLHLEVW
jgi:hypothetical protein